MIRTWSRPGPAPSTNRTGRSSDPVLTFRKGTGGAPTAGQAMAEHLREQTIPEEMVAMADYYLRGVKRAEVAGTAAIPRQDMPLAVAEALGLDLTRTTKHEEVVNLLRGLRAD